MPWIVLSLLGVLLAPNRLPGEVAGSSPDALEGVDIDHRKKTGETYYTPSIDRWPPPDFDIYPVIARGDAKEKRLLLRVVLNGTDDRKMKAFELTIDGAPERLDLNEAGKAKVDSRACRPSAEVELPGHEDLVRRIAAAATVGASYDEAKKKTSYAFVGEDLERFRRMLALFDKDDLPLPSVGTVEPMRRDDFPTPVFKSPPAYPQEARLKHIQGSVTLEALVLRDGSVGRVRILKPAGGGCGFEEAAISAVKQWRYQPGKVKGQPADTKMTIVIDFSLQDLDPPGVDSQERRLRNLSRP